MIAIKIIIYSFSVIFNSNYFRDSQLLATVDWFDWNIGFWGYYFRLHCKLSIFNSGGLIELVQEFWLDHLSLCLGF